MDNISGSTMIETNGLGKAFRIYNRKRDRLKQIVSGGKREYHRDYWALRDIDLVLRKGESLGVVGRNGSGKSTLLQLICGTLRPTEGEVRVNGKIAALLELGSGFNPDFTGRENVFLNASLMGLTIQETKERLDKILGFADIGGFVDQPVRTYSSGMMVRLAFSVIANVDAEILVVDEALAVGDAYFTQKCMRYIQRYREEGCLLFVSHDANSVLSLCDKAILLDKGRLRHRGSPKTIIEQYTKDLQGIGSSKSVGQSKDDIEVRSREQEKTVVPGGQASENWNNDDQRLRWSDFRQKAIDLGPNRNDIEVHHFSDELVQSESFGGNSAKIVSVSLMDYAVGRSIGLAHGGEVVRLDIEARLEVDVENIIIGFILKNDKGLALLGDNSLNRVGVERLVRAEKGATVRGEFIFTLPLLPAGEYSVSASVAMGTQADHEILHWMNDALILRSQCTSVAAGLAGVAMHSIKVNVR
jgi:lipopolysaccharide transport system ATP-binding protein